MVFFFPARLEDIFEGNSVEFFSQGRRGAAALVGLRGKKDKNGSFAFVIFLDGHLTACFLEESSPFFM